MKRRSFLALAAAASLPSISFAAADYTPGLVKKHLAAGDTVFLDFKASWCSTCKAQERVIDALKKANPAYDANIVFIAVDWDQYGNSDLVKDMRIPRRSTLVAIKGDKELGRIVAGTSKSQIKALMDSALNAATA
ncbi:thioredoxin family protein [Cognatishimia sp. 1_MG-2023]|uniref:thioredoxin family protein n=1 Tax=Cognatishimia sp. 1_MG-2023 TaxID=3062642 RepID=UPI0026E2FBE1|nr:thioredoxin family protein [Cognatishimia sp. 1_MG-2023]MDO6727150.1 thioredoxin family protein [Cognatishimia sp. 1_MG-2023]